MSATLSKSLRLSSTLNIEEEAMVTKKQGIVSILGSDCEKSSPKAASLRRTLSADMSSKKWLSQHGFSSSFSPMKKTASSQEFRISITEYSSSSSPSLSEEEEDDEQEIKEAETQDQFDIWSSIQEEKNKKELEKPGQFDIWSSILSQKTQEDSSKSLPSPPYIHPLVKRSQSCLSEKSLEICTESLGSESGSDGFSSYPSSETSDIEEDKEEEEEGVQQQGVEQEEVQEEEEEEEEEESFDVVKYNYVVGKKLPQGAFPPPIPSLSCGGGGSSLRMQSRRDNGRLVLEAVSVPSQNNFRAQRQDGRLVLTFVDSPFLEDDDQPINNEEGKEIEEFEEKLEEEFEEEFEDFEEEEESEKDEEEEEEIDEIKEENEGEKKIGFVLEQSPINVHRLALMVNKTMGLANRNPTWPKKFNEAVKKFEELEEEIEETPLAKSLPPRASMVRLIPQSPATVATAAAAAASFNVYDYYWRPKPMSTQPPPPKNNSNSSSSKLILSKNPVANEHQEMVVLRGNNGDYFVPLVKGCKEPRRSLLIWEPYCIATS